MLPDGFGELNIFWRRNFAISETFGDAFWVESRAIRLARCVPKDTYPDRATIRGVGLPPDKFLAAFKDAVDQLSNTPFLRLTQCYSKVNDCLKSHSINPQLVHHILQSTLPSTSERRRLVIIDVKMNRPSASDESLGFLGFQFVTQSSGNIDFTAAAWMVVLLSLSFGLLIGSILADSSCYSECKQDRSPMCGVWLEKEENAAAAGTYQLNAGVVNMSCEFTSRPAPAQVIWQHRPSDEIGGNWIDFACSTKDENKICSQDVEHRVTSQCILRITSLNSTGNSEIVVNVAGIEKIEKVDSQLTVGQAGFIEVEICANPKPEVTFLVNGQLLGTGEADGKAAVSLLRQLKIRTRNDGPARPKPYCHSIRLMLARVEATDSVSVIVRNEGETRTEPLQLNLKKNTAIPSVLMSILISLLISILI
ncbi:unnamed protein product, partial [Mesorhabditis spiculigera]